MNGNSHPKFENRLFETVLRYSALMGTAEQSGVFKYESSH
jgi:hypothetical protein